MITLLSPSLDSEVVQYTHRDFLVLAEFLDQGQQPYAGCLSDMGVLAGYIPGQDGVEDPRNHIVVFHIWKGKEESGNVRTKIYISSFVEGAFKV